MLRQAYYDNMATIVSKDTIQNLIHACLHLHQIQKMWRGYYVRRYVHNYYAQKAYLEALERKNEIIRSVQKIWCKKNAFTVCINRDQLEKYKEDLVTSQLARDDAIHQLREIEEARRYHYMLSTEIVGYV